MPVCCCCGCVFYILNKEFRLREGATEFGTILEVSFCISF